MAKKRKFKVGDKVRFDFAGNSLDGSITKIEEIENKYGGNPRTRMTISDGKYVYPVNPDSITEIL